MPEEGLTMGKKTGDHYYRLGKGQAYQWHWSDRDREDINKQVKWVCFSWGVCISGDHECGRENMAPMLERKLH